MPTVAPYDVDDTEGLADLLMVYEKQQPEILYCVVDSAESLCAAAIVGGAWDIPNLGLIAQSDEIPYHNTYSLPENVEIRVLVTEENCFERVFDDFQLAVGADPDSERSHFSCRLTNLETGDGPQIEGSGTVGPTPLFVTKQSIGVPTTVVNTKSWLGQEDTEFCRQIHEAIEHAWQRGSPLTTEYPSWTTVRTSIEDKFNEELAADFIDLMWSDHSLHPGRGEIDVGTLIMIWAAKNGEFQKDVYNWAKSINISNSLCHRRKSKLQEANVLTTSREKRGKGAPLVRLHLTREYETVPKENLLEAVDDALHTRSTDSTSAVSETA